MVLVYSQIAPRRTTDQRIHRIVSQKLLYPFSTRVKDCQIVATTRRLLNGPVSVNRSISISRKYIDRRQSLLPLSKRAVPLIATLVAVVLAVRFFHSPLIQSNLPGVGRALCHLCRTGIFNAPRANHGLRWNRTVARPATSSPPKQPLEVWARALGMDWRIEEAEVRFVAAGGRSLGSIHASPEQMVRYRSDNKAPLSVVSARYQVVQPEEILEIYRDLTEIGRFQLETAGVLKEGRKLWALASTGQSGTLKGKDQINGYLLLVTACDGTLATTAQFTSVRVVCNNTLQIAWGNSAGAIKV